MNKSDRNKNSYFISKNSGAVKVYRKKAFITHKTRIYNRNKKARDNLNDYIIVKYLRATGWSFENITPELIEVKRQLIILNRQIKWQISRM